MFSTLPKKPIEKDLNPSENVWEFYERVMDDYLLTPLFITLVIKWYLVGKLEVLIVKKM